MSRKFIVPVKNADGTVRRVPLPLSSGGRDLPEAGAWIDNDRWVQRRFRDGDVTDGTTAQLEAMTALEEKTVAAQQAAEAAAAKAAAAAKTAATAPATTGTAASNAAATNASATKGS